MMRPNTARKDTDLVYNFCRTETVVEESEKGATDRRDNYKPNTSKAICTTFNSLKVICLEALAGDQSPDTAVSTDTCSVCAPNPKSDELVKSSSLGD